MRIPRLLIAGTASGVGKTTFTLGLLQAFMKRGLILQPFKVGPDYIDPGFHSAVSGRLSRNLDLWLIPRERLTSLFIRACEGADGALIEGVMGLYDGIGAEGHEGSTAHLAKLFRCPVLLVLDASAIAGSAAAVVKGFATLDPEVPLVGCLLNRVGGPGHYALVKKAVEKQTGIRVLGFLPKDEALALPERHLGLIPSQEGSHWRKIMGPLVARIRESVDLTEIWRLAKRALPLTLPSPPPGGESAKMIGGSAESCGGEKGEGVKLSRIPVGVAMDEAFHFYYPENLELLQELGVEIVPFSPLSDHALPAGVQGLYLGGGFPEIYASPLSANKKLHRDIREKIGSGIPTYAECGGLMFLARSIIDGHSKRFPMAGLIPGDVRMTRSLQNFGYKKITARCATLLARKGEQARGHEFHHSVLEAALPKGKIPYELASPTRDGKQLEGYCQGNLVASYVHLNFLSNPRWARRFVQRAQLWRKKK